MVIEFINNQNPILIRLWYKVDFVFLRPHKKRLLKEEPGKVSLSKDEWFKEILKGV